MKEIRALVGDDARPTIVFDRSGWSLKLFAELERDGFRLLIYRKAPLRADPRSAFFRYELTDDLGRTQVYWLAECRVRLSYKDGRRLRRFGCRQVTQLDPATGYQIQILTTRTDLAAEAVAYAMFSRWCQENFFRYLRHSLGVDVLDSYAKVPDDLERSVPNPAKKAAARSVREAKADVAGGEATEGRAALAGCRNGRDKEVADAFAAANDEVAARTEVARAVPARVPLGHLDQKPSVWLASASASTMPSAWPSTTRSRRSPGSSPRTTVGQTTRRGRSSARPPAHLRISS